MRKGLSIAEFVLGIITVLCGAAVVVLSAVSLKQKNGTIY